MGSAGATGIPLLVTSTLAYASAIQLRWVALKGSGPGIRKLLKPRHQSRWLRYSVGPLRLNERKPLLYPLTGRGKPPGFFNFNIITGNNNNVSSNTRRIPDSADPLRESAHPKICVGRCPLTQVDKSISHTIAISKNIYGTKCP